MKKKHAVLMAAAGIALISTGCMLYSSANGICVTDYETGSTKLPAEFDGYRIAQVSDLHNRMFGKAQSRLLNKLAEARPDIIVVTGDLIDRRGYNLQAAMTFIDGAVKLAPVYYVSGNHEMWSGEYGEIKESLTASGVKVLDGSSVALTRGDAEILLCGLTDPSYVDASGAYLIDKSGMTNELAAFSGGDSAYRILLAHRPEFFDYYKSFDLILSGHTHGGQLRLPFFGGFYAPDQGFFPKYISGRYDDDTATIIISRGMGSSVMPLRTFNVPELVVATLRAE